MCEYMQPWGIGNEPYLAMERTAVSALTGKANQKQFQKQKKRGYDRGKEI